MININGKQWNELTYQDIESAIIDNDESFFFEYKEDDVKPEKVVQEISAFSNTFGGYIFIGVSDNKEIKGCKKWDEQRVHITIHESMSPIPLFDVKKFIISDNKNILVIKIDEGLELPYMTNKGMIYERISSGTFCVKDSSKLTQMYYKNEHQLKKTEEKLSIPFTNGKIGNIYGYIDVGFELKTSNQELLFKKFNDFDICSFARQQYERGDELRQHITKCGNSIIVSLDGLSSSSGEMPAHVNNFAEYMIDGSVKFRTLIMKNSPNEKNVNMIYNILTAQTFEYYYKIMFGDILTDVFTGAKKYESLICLEQFYPRLFYGDDITKDDALLREKDIKISKLIREHSKYVAEDLIITNNRIPKNGFYNVDRTIFNNPDYPMTIDNLIAELFESSFFRLGMVPGQEKI